MGKGGRDKSMLGLRLNAWCRNVFIQIVNVDSVFTYVMYFAALERMYE